MPQEIALVVRAIELIETSIPDQGSSTQKAEKADNGVQKTSFSCSFFALHRLRWSGDFLPAP